MTQSKWIWPVLIVLSGLLIGWLSFTNSAIGLRPLAALWFLLVCPGMAFVLLMPIDEMVVRWTLAVALSLALDGLVATTLIYAHLWSPNAALLILIAASLTGAGLQVIPDGWLAPRILSRKSLRVEEDDLRRRRAVKSAYYHTTSPRSVTSPIARDTWQVVSKALSKSNDRILFVYSDGMVNARLCDFMRAHGYATRCFQSGDEVMKIMAEIKPDLVLLDLVKPDSRACDVLLHLGEKSSIPSIILTKKREDADILHCFHLGASDFITKPISYEKLEVRFADVLNHSRRIHITKDMVTSEELSINFQRKEVMTNLQKVNLTATEYRLLELLARHANRTMPLSLLMTELRGRRYESDKRYIRRLIFSLRRKIESKPGKPKHLITRRGYGYRLE